MKNIIFSYITLFYFGLASCQAQKSDMIMNPSLDSNWLNRIESTLPLLGHRNWILVVDKAYPAPSETNITVINTGLDMPLVVKKLANLLKTQNHIRPIFYQDEELKYIDEKLVPGIDTFKNEIRQILGSNIKVIPHTTVFQKIDDASKLFNIVVLKTESLLPYTSLFIELDCKYWNEEKEQQLRQHIQKATISKHNN